jgi:S1-C subfamily serine protease
VAVDEAHDLALLKAARRHPHGIPYPAVPLALEEPETNARLTVTGHPGAALNAVTLSGRIIRRARMRLGSGGGEASEVFLLGIRLERGASGSPVYDARGAVVGVISRRNPSNLDQTVAVSIRHAIRLLEREGVAWTAAKGKPAGE